MNIPCEMAQDLLPLYEDGLCSPTSKTAVENHLRTCRQCRVQAERVRQFVQPELAVQSQKETSAVARSFRKVRLRWLASLVITLMLIPLMFLTVNQIRGQGLCFSNLGYILAAGRYVRALEQGDVEQAAACMDYEGMYEEILSLLERTPEDWDMNCTTFTIGDEVWLAKGDLYQQYLWNESDPLTLWTGLLHHRIHGIMIPEAAWQEILTRESDSVIVLEDGRYLLHEVIYAPLETPWGSYVTEADTHVTQCRTAAEFCAELELIPEAIYNAALPELRTQAAEQYAYIQQTYGAVRQMDLAGFTDHVTGAYADDLTQCLLGGYRFASTGYAGSDFFDGYWHIDYGVELSHGNAHCRMVLSFRIDHGKLDITGMSHRESIQGLDDVCERLFLSYPIAETQTTLPTDEG